MTINIMSYYECKRCGHIVKQKVEIIRHLNRKNKCSRIINSYNYNDNELEKASMIKHNYVNSQYTKNNYKETNKYNDLNINKNNKIPRINIIDNDTNDHDNNDRDNNNRDNNNHDNNVHDNNVHDNNVHDNNVHDNNVHDNNVHDNNVHDNNNNDNNVHENNDNAINDDIKITDDFKHILNNNIDQNISHKSNTFNCDICFKHFTRKYNLLRHKKNCSSDNFGIHEVKDKDTSNNTTNNFNTINNNYNKNLFVNFNVEPFDNEWDVSKITKFTRHSILLSKIMYSNLLDNILQNEKNLNVLIEKDTNTGIVYKNNVEKFITMNIQDIIDKSMDKLNKHLKDFYNESMKDDEFIIMKKIFQEQILNIEDKYNDFKNNVEIKKKVEDFITQIYDQKKENAINLYNNTLLKNNDDNGY